MGNEYNWTENIVKDFLFSLLLQEEDITASKYKEGIEQNIKHMLIHSGVNAKDLPYLEYNIKAKDDIYFKLVADNIITAMWLSGFYPEKCDLIYTKNSATFDNKNFKFNKRTKKLTWTEKG